MPNHFSNTQPEKIFGFSPLFYFSAIYMPISKNSDIKAFLAYFKRKACLFICKMPLLPPQKTGNFLQELRKFPQFLRLSLEVNCP
jgi:hypothetical protein